MDIGMLSPEEKATLLEQLQGGGGESSQLESMLGMIVQKIDDLEARHAQLEKTVMEEIIGGITNLYKENSRIDGIKGLKGKYGDLFGPHEGAFSELYGGDVYEKLFDHMEGLRGGEGFTEESGDATLKEIAQQLAEKIAKVKGPKEPEKEVAIAVQAEEDPTASIADGIRKMKSKGKTHGIIGEPRD